MLTFVSYTGNKTNDGHLKALFQCDCGEAQEFCASRVKNGYANMCKKCQAENLRKKATTHGMKKTKEYSTWNSMKTRCHNKNDKNYWRYGGSGIFVCEEWRNDFERFFKHVGKCPSKNHSIDRIDNSKGYEPGNVRWADRSEQARNKGNTTYVTDGKSVFHINEVAEKLNITRGAAHMRLKRGKLDGYSKIA